MIRSFSLRTTLWFATLTTGILVVALTLGGGLLHWETNRGLELLHQLEIEELAELLEQGEAGSAEEIHQLIGHDADADAEIFFIQVRGNGGEILFRSENLGSAVIPDWSHQGLHWTYELPEVGPIRVSSERKGAWQLQIASHLESSDRLLQEYLRIAVLLILGGAMASFAIGWGFTRLVLSPIRSIERTARKIGADNLGERIPVPSGHDELVALATLLNETFGRIESAFGQVRRFTADASHELKTPLSLIKLNAERLRPRFAGDPESQTALDDVLEEIERLHQIIEHLLFLSKAESGILRLQFEKLPLPVWLQDWKEDATVLADEAGFTFQFAATNECEIRGVPSLLRQLLFNLLSNAMKFSPPNGTVRLRMAGSADQCDLIFEDEGPGVPPKELSRIFDRFVRIAPPASTFSDANKTEPGHGLGLAICKSIVELHKGSIRMENRIESHGLRVIVSLPASG